MTEHQRGGPFDGWPIIFKYTREQAIDDGVLIDVTEQAKKSGFKFHTVITCRVMAEVVAASPAAVFEGETNAARLSDVLWMLLVAVRLQRPGNDPDRINFQVIATDADGHKITHKLWSQCGPGDHGEPVITIMMQGED